jgi:hypothetical protein
MLNMKETAAYRQTTSLTPVNHVKHEKQFDMQGCDPEYVPFRPRE